MGNLCSSSSDKDPFSQPGRTLDSAPPAASSSRVPKHVGGPPRTLGGSSPAGGYGTSGSGGQTEEQRIEARRAAAEAAEARARNASKPAGKLGQDLQKQKAQTRRDTLEQMSREERRARDSDAAAESRAHN